MKGLLGRLRGGGMATDSMWGMGLELSMMISMMLTFVLLGRSLGSTGYGSYVVLYSIVSPLVTLASSGVTLALLQHVVRDGAPLGETARASVTVSLAFGAGITGIGALLAFLIVDGLAGYVMIAILVTEFVVSPLIAVAASTVQASGSFSGAARIRIAQAGSKAVLVVVLFAAQDLTVSTLGVGSLATSIVLAAAALWMVGRRFGFAFRPGRSTWSLVRTNVVYSVGISAASFNNDGDKTVLGANGFVTQAGLYGAAGRIVNLGMVPVVSLSSASHREFLLRDEFVKGQHLRRAVRYAKMSAAYGVAAGGFLILVAPLLPLVMGDDFDGSVTMLRWLSPLILLRAMTIFPLNALMGLGHTLFRSVVIVANAVLAVTLYIALIPSHGWRGAVAGTLISESVEMVTIWAFLVWAQRRADRAIARPASDRSEADAVQTPPSGSGPAPAGPGNVSP